MNLFEAPLARRTLELWSARGLGVDCVLVPDAVVKKERCLFILCLYVTDTMVAQLESEKYHLIPGVFSVPDMRFPVCSALTDVWPRPALYRYMGLGMIRQSSTFVLLACYFPQRSNLIDTSGLSRRLSWRSISNVSDHLMTDPRHVQTSSLIFDIDIINGDISSTTSSTSSTSLVMPTVCTLKPFLGSWHPKTALGCSAPLSRHVCMYAWHFHRSVTTRVFCFFYSS